MKHFLHLQPASRLEYAFFTSYRAGDKLVSFFGDSHPFYAGSVVKAMASARNGYRHIARLFADDIAAAEHCADSEAADEHLQLFFDRLKHDYTATVVRIERLTPTIVELMVRAPAAARKFRPGQFYRLQNYAAQAPIVAGHRLVMEALAMTGAWTDPDAGLLSMIALEVGASTRMISHLREGERVVVMGPTGTPTEIPENENVLLCGGGLGNAVLFSIAHALKSRGCRVIYFAGYRNGRDVFKMSNIEAATDQVVWCTDAGNPITPRRQQDRHWRGTIIEAMVAYHRGALGERLVPFETVQRIIAIGSDGMMNAVRQARYTVLRDAFGPHVAIGSINSPMQCMMKEICAQCLQKHRDPLTGRELVPVFSCFNQDQELDRVDFDNLHDRLSMNSVLEKLGHSWLEYLLSYEQSIG
jgi:NAD(P)H-flavin reductase